MNKLFVLLLVFFLVFGCTESNIVLPYTTSQLIAQSTDLNYIDFVNGVYDGNYLMIDNNKLSVGAIDINSYDIDWSKLINFPSGCLDNQAVKIVGSSLVCVDLPIDTNFETAGYDFGDYVPYTGANADVDLGSNTIETYGVGAGSGASAYVNDTAKVVAMGDSADFHIRQANGDLSAIFGSDNDGYGYFFVGDRGLTATNALIRFWSSPVQENWINNGKDFGIGTTNPEYSLDVSGDARVTDFLQVGEEDTSLSFMTPVVKIGDNSNVVSGVQMGNTSTGTSADFRFIIKDPTDHYFAFSQPGVNNTVSTIFGLARKTTDFIFNSGGTSRDMGIGTGSGMGKLVLATDGSERMRIDTDGKVGIGTDSLLAKLDLMGDAIVGREQFIRVKNSDSGNDVFGVTNGTSTANNFAPTFYGMKSSNYGTGYIYNLNFRGLVPTAQDTVNAQRFGVINFETFLTGSETDPNNSLGGAVQNRTLYTFQNNNEVLLRINPDRSIDVPYDNQKLVFGAGQDGDISWNGSELEINPKVVINDDYSNASQSLYVKGTAFPVFTAESKTSTTSGASSAFRLYRNNSTGAFNAGTGYIYSLNNSSGVLDNYVGLYGYAIDNTSGAGRGGFTIATGQSGNVGFRPNLWSPDGLVLQDGSKTTLNWANTSNNNEILTILEDNRKFLLGASRDSSISYDGSNLVIDPKEIGSGYLNVAGDVLVDEDLNVDGNVHSSNYVFKHKIWHAFGGFEDAMETINLTQNVWHDINNIDGNLWGGNEVDGFSFDSDRLVVANGADYSGNLVVTLSGLANTDFEIRVYNVTQDRKEGFHISFTGIGVNNYIPVSLPIYLEASSNDVFALQVRNISNNNDVTIGDGSFFINYLHD